MEDRCDLNGLAMDVGKPCFVAAVAQMDVADSWRDHRGGGGWVIDTGSSEIVALGLSMPYLRRFYRDILWLRYRLVRHFRSAERKVRTRYVYVRVSPRLQFSWRLCRYWSLQVARQQDVRRITTLGAPLGEKCGSTMRSTGSQLSDRR